jgi:hypothetical protein
VVADSQPCSPLFDPDPLNHARHRRLNSLERMFSGAAYWTRLAASNTAC